MFTNPAVLFASLELCVLNRLGCFVDLLFFGIGPFEAGGGITRKSGLRVIHAIRFA